MKSGDRLGPFVLEGEPNRSGGNGDVWRAASASHAFPCAVKILRRTTRNRDFYPRFRDEIQFHDTNGDVRGVLPRLEYDLPSKPTKAKPAWYAMPWATPLKVALGRGARLPDVVDALVAIAETLAELAGRDVGHRDIKPENLFRYGETWAIGDFGLVTFPGKQAVTAADRKLGPTFYIAPEMLNDPGSPFGPADVYSLAKTLWVLATGQKYPLGGQLRVDDAHTALRDLVHEPNLGPLERLIERATENDPSRRPSMADLALELRAWLAPVQVTASNAPDDLSDVAERIANLGAPARRQKDEMQALRTEVAGVGERLQRLVAGMHLSLADVAALDVTEYPDAPLFSFQEIGSHRDLNAQHCRGVLARTADADPIQAIVAAGVQWPSGLDLRIAAAAWIDDRYRGPAMIWSEVHDCVIGSAIADQAISSITRQLPEQVRPLILELARRMELREDADRYAAWGSDGDGRGEFRAPGATFCNTSDSGCYVVDTLNNRIQRFQRGGAWVDFGPHAVTAGNEPGQCSTPRAAASTLTATSGSRIKTTAASNVSPPRGRWCSRSARKAMVQASSSHRLTSSLVLAATGT